MKSSTINKGRWLVVGLMFCVMGCAGLFLGRMLVTNFLGKVGAAIISMGVVIGGLFFVSQTHPVELWRTLESMWLQWRERREEWAASRRTAQEQAEREARLLEKEREKLERELEKERRIQEREERRLQKEREQQKKQRNQQAVMLGREKDW